MLRNILVVFLIKFFVIYGLLIFPWPGFDEAYAGFFRQVGTWAFSSSQGSRDITFEPHFEQHNFTTLYSRMNIANRSLPDTADTPRVAHVGLDERSIGWVPTAMTIALILASPVSWRRKFWALLGGLVLIEIFILLTLQVSIWDNSPLVSLAHYSPTMQSVLDGMNYVMVDQLGISFSVPLVIWILVTFRRSDLELFNKIGHDLRKTFAK